MKKFLKSFPTVNVHVEYRRSNEVYEDVLGNVVDLGLVAYPVRDPKLEIIPLRKDKMVLICSPHHPFSKEKSIRLKQLSDQKFVAFEPDIPTRKAIDKILKDQNVHVQNVMEFDNIETVNPAAAGAKQSRLKPASSSGELKPKAQALGFCCFLAPLVDSRRACSPRC